ncbi:MAG: hypothetical protein ACRC28_18565 [Clostridium sp.]|uniref:hypothetical protein n=1 Tax=Clostridium sp. TaxID=1506 RepID=UPI003F3DD853
MTKLTVVAIDGTEYSEVFPYSKQEVYEYIDLAEEDGHILINVDGEEVFVNVNFIVSYHVEDAGEIVEDEFDEELCKECIDYKECLKEEIERLTSIYMNK